jgi:hypothetical protein
MIGLVNNKLEMMWKDKVWAEFEVLSWQPPGWPEKFTQTLTLDKQYPT